MFCRKCGAELNDAQEFCPKCGTAKNGFKNIQAVNDIKNKITGSKFVGTAKEKISNTKMSKKKILAIGTSAIAVVIVAICLIANYASVGAMRKALKENDYYKIQYEYSSAYSSSSKIKKMDRLIADKIDDIEKDLDKYDFKSASQSTEDAIENWLSSYGTLFENDEYSGTNYNFESCISYNNKAKWDELLDKIESKKNYCNGVYLNANKLYSEAITSLSYVSQDDSSYEDAEELIADSMDSYINQILKEADAYIASNEIDSALDMLENAKLILDNTGVKSDDIQAKIDETIKKYADTYAEKAKENFNKNDALAAVGNIKIALELLPNNADYQAQKSKYESYIPYELYNENNLIKSDGDPNFYESETANNGTEMKNIIHVDLYWKDSASCTYNLNGKYDVVKGQEFLSKGQMNQDGTTYFVAYGDGKELYTSPKITAGVLPKNVSFNVSGVQTLEIKFYKTSDSYDSAHFYLSGLTAQKSIKGSE